MTDPTDDELERAERIKRLREGEALPRRERRRPDPPDALEGHGTDDDREADETDVDHEGPLQPAGDLELPADAPDDLTVASLYLRTALETRVADLEEDLERQYARRYDGNLDGPRHVRQLALFLGVRQLEKLDVDEIHALFEAVEEVESP